MHLTHLTRDDYRRMSWKNGGGMTTELMIEPDDEGGYLWRLSIAEVMQSGPFSDFAGYDRTIMLLDGAGFVLSFDPVAAKGAREQRIARPFKPFRFDGAWPTECTLIDGPIRDFNLIAARSGPPARMNVLQLEAETTNLPASQTTIVHLLRGRASAAGREMQQGDTLRIDGSEQAIAFSADVPAVAVMVQIGKRSSGRGYGH